MSQIATSRNLVRPRNSFSLLSAALLGARSSSNNGDFLTAFPPPGRKQQELLKRQQEIEEESMIIAASQSRYQGNKMLGLQDFLQRNCEWNYRVKEKLKEKQSQLLERDFKECTFKPNNPYYKKCQSEQQQLTDSQLNVYNRNQ